jgi:hypothetical protein
MEAQGTPIDINGVPSVRIYSIQLQPKAEFHVKRVANIDEPIQCLHISTDRPILEIDGHRFKDTVLWADTSRPEITVRSAGRVTRTVKFWNSWLTDTREDAWMRNAAIQFEEIDSGVRLNCSDGRGDLDFTDFIVEITVNDPRV